MFLIVVLTIPSVYPAVALVVNAQTRAAPAPVAATTSTAALAAYAVP
jgi:hypothetical protein